MEDFWETLKFEISLVGAELLPDDKREVLIGCGNKNADILFIGDDPSLYFDETPKFEVGSSGFFLNRLLDIEDISTNMYYITTISKRPVKIKTFMGDARNKLLSFLDMQIALINPKIIVLLGKEAYKALLGREDFEENLGNYLLWKGGIKVLVTYDVKTVMEARMDESKKSRIPPNFWRDIKTIKQNL